MREKLVEYQRDMADDIDVVLEGRDIGTVVFPDSEYKFFLIADLDTRVNRRYLQFLSSTRNSKFCHFKGGCSGNGQ